MKRSGPALWLTVVAAIATVLVIASVVINLVADNGPNLRPEDTAEGAVQRYLRAFVDNDVTTAYDYISPSLKTDCTLQHFIEYTQYQRTQDFTARLTGTNDLSGVKLVNVEISDPGGQLFGSNYSYTVSFTLAQEDGRWLFSQPPWPMSWCPPADDGQERPGVTLSSGLPASVTAPATPVGEGPSSWNS